MRRILIRAGIVLAAFVIALALVEMGMRVWARVEGMRMAEELTGNDPLHRPIVVFCGDSNIYGVYVKPDETLPAAVERLSRQPAGNGIRCINIGVPGRATWDTLDQVQRALVVHPAAIVVTCGINNYSIKPVNEGWGILEGLRIVQTIRRMLFNYKLSRAKRAPTKLELGPDGKAIEGSHQLLDDGHGVVIVQDREGKVQVQERRGVGDADLDFAWIAPGMRRDFLAMAEAASKGGSKLVIATYLAGMDSHFLEISKLMREVAATGAAALADCAATYPQAMRHGFDGTIASVPSYVVQNRRSMILVEDCHPTSLGYEIEARVVASALHALGVLPNYVPEEPTKILDGASVVLPTLTRSAADPRLFEITTAPKDHVILFLGSEGISRTHNAIIPLDTSVVDGLKARYQLGDFAADADADGKAIIRVGEAFLREIPKPIRAAVLAERGGSPPGSTRRFLSPPQTLSSAK